jgi:hypothetical protein
LCFVVFSSSLSLVFAQSVVDAASESKEKPKISVGASSAEFGSTAGSAGIGVDELGTNQVDPDKKKRGEFAATPIPVVNPTIGNGLGGIGMYAVHFDKHDGVSPPSVLAGGGFATDNGSWLLALGAKLHLSKDRFRVLGGAATGRLNYDFFGIGNEGGSGRPAIPLTQKISGFLIEPKFRFVGNWFVGPRYHLSKSAIALDWDKIEGERPPNLPEQDFRLQTAALGFKVEWDTRDNQFYPLRGSFFDVKTDFFSPKFGGDRTYQSLNISYAGFHSFCQKNVIAYRVSACGSSDDAPFYDICLLGLSKDIRGYQIGEYRDYRMLVGQVEYRRELFWRFGAVGFLGAGQVAETFGNFSTDQIKPGGGFGLRFLLARENKVNVRIDYAWGKDSSALYIGLGEVF